MVFNPAMKYKKHQIQFLFNLHDRKQILIIGHFLSWPLNSPHERKQLLVSILKTVLSSIQWVSWSTFLDIESAWICSLAGILPETRNMFVFIVQKARYSRVFYSTLNIFNHVLTLYMHRCLVVRFYQ